MPGSSIRFVLDGEIIEVDDVDPTRTVLQFLREDLRRKGTKEGCAEGDCGACTVVVAEVNRDGDDLSLKAINSCIQFLPTIDGKELITVESLAPAGSQLHPVQRAMVQNHGSQCGFCTPGFVMSLFALYKTNASPSRREIDDALAGNLCRCTGYRPIIAAAQAMYEQGDDECRSDWLQQPCGAQQKPDGRIAKLGSLARTEALDVERAGRRFCAPRDIDSFATLYVRNPEATILAGGTDVGLWVTKQHRELEKVIYTGCVAELTDLSVSPTHIEVGAAVTLSDIMPVIVDHYPGLDELFRRFASPPIRNAGTLGGNIANGSPIGDTMPALMVVGASLVLRCGDATRELPLDEFYHDYQVNDLAPGEFLERVRIPLADPRVIVQSQKWSKRFDQDISAVCTAYCLTLDGDKVSSFRMACGGLAAVIKRATHCETALEGQRWNEKSIEQACRALQEDFTPISDMRASADIRLRAVQNLLRRFFHETKGNVDSTVYTYGRQR
ncbi:MAG: xanthine dehydrogenase small subunit [Gammaproteobacteria bacterium]|nr:xanthine dehydrogenase small subunit [Gammaproteobacteria bacterium]MDH3577328.1 xanthine dehydrogenase small subunit [Gammaproteobacteria bacterium]